MDNHQSPVLELTGVALDYWTAVADGKLSNGKTTSDKISTFAMYYHKDERYSSDWAKGGPIVERERIQLYPTSGKLWRATTPAIDWVYGETPLIAAMRAFVVLRLGETVPPTESRGHG